VEKSKNFGVKKQKYSLSNLVEKSKNFGVKKKQKFWWKKANISPFKSLDQRQFMVFLAFAERFMINETELKHKRYRFATKSNQTDDLERINFNSTHKFKQFDITDNLLCLFEFIKQSNMK